MAPVDSLALSSWGAALSETKMLAKAFFFVALSFVADWTLHDMIKLG